MSRWRLVPGERWCVAILVVVVASSFILFTMMISLSQSVVLIRCSCELEGGLHRGACYHT